ncbi:MAG TPA: PaaI family thioesterase [Spirochaetota bacterium]|nr:PaaI family thioesterase [Spirochaetota bacterium]HNT10105.1 PaaI family thioesterase [Spirochaetota bacterium]
MKEHTRCYYCGTDGFIFTDYTATDTGAQARITIEKKHEGWPGIPHGGMGMTALIELTDLIDGTMDRYPLDTRFRFGGERLALGDTVDIGIEKREDAFHGAIRTPGGVLPYLSATIKNAVNPAHEERVRKLSERLAENALSHNSFLMPDFSDRLIFRQTFQDLHRYRLYEFRDQPDGSVIMICFFSDRAGGLPANELNTITDDHVHPGPLITLLDETLGWAGFLAVWQGGVTVTLDAYFMRPLRPDEIIFAVGICDSQQGSFTRKMVTCSGGIFSRTGDSIEPVAYATGKWLTKPEFKEKMLAYLLHDDNYLSAAAIYNKSARER